MLINEWYHVAAVIHPLQGMILFIDGVRQSSTTPYIFPPNSSNSPTLLGTQGSLSGKFLMVELTMLGFRTPQSIQ